MLPGLFYLRNGGDFVTIKLWFMLICFSVMRQKEVFGDTLGGFQDGIKGGAIMIPVVIQPGQLFGIQYLIQQKL